MRKPAAGLFLSLTLICLLPWAVGCARPTARPGVQAGPVWCPGPPVPKLAPLNAAEQLCSPGNTDRTLKNLSALRTYAGGLEEALACYESQLATNSEKAWIPAFAGMTGAGAQPIVGEPRLK